MKDSSRLGYIDALRGIAILGVIAVHSASIPSINGGLLRTVTDVGQYGVQLFFVVSAFTILLSLERHRYEDSHMYSKFFVRRIFRIVPVYWVGIVLYTSVYGMGSRTLLPGPDLWHFPVHIMMLNVLHPSTLSSVVPGGWSISLEVLFYLTVPFFFAIVTNLKRAIVFSCVSVVFLPAINLLLSQSLGDFFKVDDPVLNRLYWYRFPLNQVGAFSMGFLLFYVIRDGLFQEYLKDRKLNGFLLVTVFFICVFLSISKIILPPRHLVYSILFCVIGLLLSQYPWAIIVNRPLRYLGKISYSCYLLHFFILNVLYEYQSQMGIDVDNEFLRYLVFFIFTVVLTVPVASLSYRFVECPAISAGKVVSRKFGN